MNWRHPAQHAVWSWSANDMRCGQSVLPWPEIVVSLLGILFLAGLLLIDQTKIGEIILWRV